MFPSKLCHIWMTGMLSWPVWLIPERFIDYLFIYLITEAKQSNAMSKNHNKQVIIVPAAKANKGLKPLTRGRKQVRYN